MSYKNNTDNNGCGLIIAAILIVGFCIIRCGGNSDKHKSDVIVEEAIEVNDEGDFDNDNSLNYFEDELSETEAQYSSNSLSTGSKPYSSNYGEGYECPLSQCSAIKVTAPRQSDIVVIIKRNNESGTVIQHGYIRAGETYLFDLPNGTYQPFFYYGEGWNPDKEMENGVRGGFVRNESFSKDNPQDIYDAVLTYVLQLQTNGNFQTQSSSKSEVF